MAVDPTTSAVDPVVAATDGVQVRVVSLGPATVEDGRGGRVSVQDALAVDLTSPTGWPGEATEPTLGIGERRYRSYAHVDLQTLLFTVDRAPVGAIAVLRWGEREAARVALPQRVGAP